MQNLQLRRFATGLFQLGKSQMFKSECEDTVPAETSTSPEQLQVVLTECLAGTFKNSNLKLLELPSSKDPGVSGGKRASRLYQRSAVVLQRLRQDAFLMIWHKKQSSCFFGNFLKSEPAKEKAPKAKRVQASTANAESIILSFWTQLVRIYKEWHP